MKPMKTPGVYIVEKNAFPNSVVQVATAVPAFIGYTQIAKNGNKSLRDVPWRISSLSEFHQYFGDAPSPKFNIVNSGSASSSQPSPLEDGNQTDSLLNVEFSLTNPEGTEENFSIIQDGNAYALYGAIRLFFQNGGGACYIVSVGSYKDDIDGDKMMKGIKLLLKEPEPTMLVIPETTRLTRSKAVAVQQAMLMHCGEKMKNRFAILDIFSGYKDTNDPGGDPVATFRNDIGINNLDYGSAYYPWVNTSIFQSRDFSYKNLTDEGITTLKTLLPRTIEDPKVKKQIENEAKWMSETASADSEYLAKAAAQATKKAETSSASAAKAANDDTPEAFSLASEAASAAMIAETATAAAAAAAKQSLAAANPDKLKKDKDRLEAITAAKGTYKTKAVAAETAAGKAVELAKTAEESADLALQAATEAKANVSNEDLATKRTETAKTASADAIAAQKATKAAAEAAAEAVQAAAEVAKVSGPTDSGETVPTSEILDKTLRAIAPLYKDIMDEIASRMNCMPPASAMAGVYTSVDASRGVWKAPANVSLNSVTSPLVNIGHDEQEDLNVTPQGKSINAIRPFIGEGVLVWGARTLDGNSLDWRYINVRRTMIMLEESIRLASKAYVFEPNTAGTWVMIKSMIENFLTGIWKQGGLPGSVPADAFSVHVGLGDTMTPVDILEGIMRITVLVAISRPAEFIEITFQQQMQKS